MPLLRPSMFPVLGTVWLLTSTTVAEPPEAAMLSLRQATYHVARVSKAPDLDQPDPLADPAWNQAQPLGPLFRMGRPEEPSRQTSVRILCANDTLYVAARCLDPQPEAIKASTGTGDLLQDDTIEMIFTQEPDRPFPCVYLQVNAAARCNAYRCLQPFAQSVGPVKEMLGPEAVLARAGKEAHGWWACVALSLTHARIAHPTCLANVMRIRPTDRPNDPSDHAWIDLWTRIFLIDPQLQPMVIVDHLPPPPPRLQVPAPLAVGLNRLRATDFAPGCKLLVNDQPVPVATDGTCQVRITRHGPAAVQILGEDGKPAAVYSTEVPRPLIVEAVEPFQPDMRKPVALDLLLNTAAPGPIHVTLEARQADTVVGSRTDALANGTHHLELPCNSDKPGELQILARAAIPAVSAEPLQITATHWCALGLDRDHFDRYRPGIDSLATLSLYRTGLTDACNFYHQIQAGNGQYRHFGRSGTLGVSEWSAGMTYAFALVYTADWPENPYRGDPRMLASAVAGMESALAPETWHEQLRHPLNRHIQAWLLTYDLLKEIVPPEQARYWRDRLTQVTEVTVNRWIVPATHKLSFYGYDVGTGTNHYAYHAANVYTAGRVLNRPDWLELGQTMMRRLAGHERDGFFPERRGIPATHYNWNTTNALGEYYWQSADEQVKPSLLRCVQFFCRTALPGGSQIVIVHDGRNNQPYPYYFGDFVLSLTPEGQWLAHARAAARIQSQRSPAQNNPEFWFRTAENALYFRPGNPQPPPDAFEFPFLDGRALIAKRLGFVYALSAICIRPTTDTYTTDAQNAIELNHEKVGRILSGANSQQQPEAGSFCRQLRDRTEFLPINGQVQRTDTGHVAVLQFNTFKVWLSCEVLSPLAARLTVQLLDPQGDEPVIYNFFPVAPGAADLQADADLTVLNMQDLVIRCSQPVRLQRDFRIVDPYSLTYRVREKPLRAYTQLQVSQPLVLDIILRDQAASTQPNQVDSTQRTR